MSSSWTNRSRAFFLLFFVIRHVSVSIVATDHVVPSFFGFTSCKKKRHLGLCIVDGLLGLLFAQTNHFLDYVGGGRC